MGPDRAMCFTMQGSNTGRITRKGEIAEFTVPTDCCVPELTALGSGGTLWFTEYHGTQLDDYRLCEANLITNGEGSDEVPSARRPG
jgi:streptogramin lyase